MACLISSYVFNKSFSFGILNLDRFSFIWNFEVAVVCGHATVRVDAQSTATEIETHLVFANSGKHRSGGYVLHQLGEEKVLLQPGYIVKFPLRDSFTHSGPQKSILASAVVEFMRT